MKRKFSTISIIHYIRLVYRLALFILLLVRYISFRLHSGESIVEHLEKRPVLLVVTWAVFIAEMIMRFFPSRLESPGCQKQFARNYIKSGSTEIVPHDNNATMLVALLWVIGNAIFGGLYLAGILDEGIMILLCSAYSVGDMICILYFCPFQSWFLKNKCCTVCRIYNWDYAMAFTPLFFVRSSYSWSLVLLSLALLLRWEITYYRHPERFSEKTNEYLRCQNCNEKLCLHKRQLHSLWKRIEADAVKQRDRLLKH